jgi:zinc transport system substrate-binding protein
MMLRSILSAMLSSTFILTAASHAPAGDRLAVFVSIVPQKYFVQQIGKDLVDVQVMVPPGAGSHSYAPKPRQMVAVSRARLYFAIGIEIEKATLPKILSTNPTVKVVHTDRGIQKISMTAPTHRNEEGEHHEGHQQEPGGLDPHIWLSPPLVKIQARTIMNTLQEIDPGHRAVYEANYRQFVAQIDQLDTELKTIFAGQQGLQFMVFHPAWGYFAQTYGLKQVPVEIEGKSPKPAQLKELIKHARKSDIKVVFVQPQFSSKSAKLVANEIGGQVAFADPLAENWLANLREVAEKFKATLK